MEEVWLEDLGSPTPTPPCTQHTHAHTCVRVHACACVHARPGTGKPSTQRWGCSDPEGTVEVWGGVQAVGGHARAGACRGQPPQGVAPGPYPGLSAATWPSAAPLW